MLVRKGSEMVLVPGMMFTIEPMVNEGSPDFFVDEDDDWTVYTIDDSLSAQIEYMVLVTETGVEDYGVTVFFGMGINGVCDIAEMSPGFCGF